MDGDERRTSLPRRRHFDLSLAASGLNKKYGSSEVFAVVEECEAVNFFQASRVPLGQTESIRDDPNPNFVKDFRIVCETKEDEQKKIRATFFERHHAVLGGNREEFLATTEFYVGDLISHSEQCLDLHLKNKEGRVSADFGVAFVSCEKVPQRTSERQDMMTIRFGVEGGGTFAGPAAKHPCYFVVSRELPQSPGQWKRVYRSKLIKPAKQGRSTPQTNLPTDKLSVRSLCGNDPERGILIEMYQLRAGGRRSIESRATPILCGHVVTTMNALMKHMLAGSALHLECELDSWMERGRFVLDAGTIISTRDGDRKALMLCAQKLRWCSNQSELEAARQAKTMVDKDCWARREAIIDGTTMTKKWKGSQFFAIKET
eukprot:CAMPEP_0198318064 /NCGR_PEP_ID=MMETSP1450-20131203/7444_1 /TAXON_ID=753684 ORGANISM="Madagascaria erythrocladiodes, Strain CCMP3234" /NCGR_SAMPLE_ID=MMETSP1450 /ASSEMBLY_ACC=CAM_ASM_001115 /LENGTH=373 /DNA_ID=CAMNT_0044021329 /DNA_START=188 /DNA_END=1309 /DNA_ORIENTATION=-